MITKKQIKKAARRYWDKDFGTHSLSDSFKAGAKWAIKKMHKKPFSRCQENGR